MTIIAHWHVTAGTRTRLVHAPDREAARRLGQKVFGVGEVLVKYYAHIAVPAPGEWRRGMRVRKKEVA